MNLLRTATTVSLLTLVSRILGLVRDSLIAAMFGATALTDAYQVAFRIPNLLRRLFAEGAFSQAFVPVLAGTKAAAGDAATHDLIDAVGSLLFWTLFLVCIVGVIGAPVLVLLLGAGLKPEGLAAAVVMTRWMFPYIGCMSLVALAAGILNTWRHFVVPAATPVLLNISIVSCALLLAPRLAHWGFEPIYSLAIGVMIGGVLQLAVQFPALARIGVLPKLRFTRAGLREAWHQPGARRVLSLMGPAVLGVGVAQLSQIINTQISTFIGVGAPTWLSCADRLMEFPTALLGVALSAVLTPQLSTAQAMGQSERYSALLDWGLRLVTLLCVPAAVALLLFPEPMVGVLYYRGHFKASDVIHVSAAVTAYGVGLVGLIGIKVLAPGFYAKQDIRTPVRIAIFVLILTQILNAVLVPWLGVAGLALAIGLGALVNAGCLLAGLLWRGSYRPAPGWPLFALRVAVASSAMGVLLYVLAHRIDWLGLVHHELLRISWLLLSLVGAALLYFAVLALSGLNLRQFARRV